jgi:hypothetical protein
MCIVGWARVSEVSVRLAFDELCIVWLKMILLSLQNLDFPFL